MDHQNVYIAEISNSTLSHVHTYIQRVGHYNPLVRGVRPSFSQNTDAVSVLILYISGGGPTI